MLLLYLYYKVCHVSNNKLNNLMFNFILTDPLKIVVVPDSAAAQKVPPVPGLLEYRKDTKKLYVRSNETWNVIAEEKKVILYSS